jgi:hypothetical protein
MQSYVFSFWSLSWRKLIEESFFSCGNWKVQIKNVLITRGVDWYTDISWHWCKMCCEIMPMVEELPTNMKVALYIFSLNINMWKFSEWFIFKWNILIWWSMIVLWTIVNEDNVKVLRLIWLQVYDVSFEL